MDIPLRPYAPLPVYPVAYPTRILTVAFLFPERKGLSLNRVVAELSWHKTCHVELVFEDNFAFSIFAGSKLFFKPRSFSNPEYTLISLTVSHAEYVAVYNFCKSAMTHDIGFTDVGMVAAYVQPCPMVLTAPSLETGYTFCSKVVTEALQMGPVQEVEHLSPCTTTPSFLYGALLESKRKIHHSVTYKCEQLKQVGSVFGQAADR